MRRQVFFPFIFLIFLTSIALLHDFLSHFLKKKNGPVSEVHLGGLLFVLSLLFFDFVWVFSHFLCLFSVFLLIEVFYACAQRATLFSLATLSQAHESHQCPD